MGESLSARVDRKQLEALGQLVDAGQLHPQVEAVLPLDQVREALERVGAATHTRQDRAADRAVALRIQPLRYLACASGVKVCTH